MSASPSWGARWALALVALLVAMTAPAGAEVRRLVVSSRQEILGGDYEKLAGTVELELDPTHPANAVIVDLERAPRNARGRVEASADFMVLRPRRPSGRRSPALLEVSNRGGKAALPYFNRAAWSLDPTTDADFGDRLLMRLNLTVIWVGWQFDVPRQPGLLRLHAPIAGAGDAPLEGLVRSDWTIDRPAPTLSAEGPDADRALAFARRFAGHHGLTAADAAAHLVVHRAIPAHSGLGSGTQLALAVARALAELRGLPTEVTALARAVGRGRRSAIGTWTFALGGFVLEGGRKGEDGAVAPLLARLPLPGAWRCVVVVPRGKPGLTGSASPRAGGSCATSSTRDSTRTRPAARCSTACSSTPPAPGEGASTIVSRSRRATPIASRRSSIRPTSFRSRAGPRRTPRRAWRTDSSRARRTGPLTGRRPSSPTPATSTGDGPPR